ncbi:MAG TPA: hypothetical protein VGG45_18805 [Terracidiphilus sp.]|jgi:hypothetical protein
MNRASYLALVLLVCGAIWFEAQDSASQQNGNQALTNMAKLRQRSQEDEIARIIDAMRARAGLFRLKRLRSSRWDLRLTCTAAVKNQPLEDWVGLQLFRVHAPQELNGDAAFSRLITKEAGKELPRYSVTVFIAPNGSPEQSLLVVGIFPQESWSDHLKGCLFTEDGCNYSSDLKKIVVPGCNDLR